MIGLYWQCKLCRHWSELSVNLGVTCTLQSHSFFLVKVTSFLLKPLTPKSDKHLISPFNVPPELNIKVTGIKEMITRSSFIANRILLLRALRNVLKTIWRICRLNIFSSRMRPSFAQAVTPFLLTPYRIFN